MKKILIVLVVLAVSGVAFAEPTKERGAYIGGGLAGTVFDDDGLFAGFGFDDTDSGFGVFGGYKFFPYLAVEGRYSDFGSFSAEGFLPLEITAASVHVVGIIPFGSSGWELFGQLGLGSASWDDGFDSDDEGVGSAGLGVRFGWGSNFSVAAQLDAYAYEECDFGPCYDLGVSSTMISFQYIF
jgi:hypothetical protein